MRTARWLRVLFVVGLVPLALAAVLLNSGPGGTPEPRAQQAGVLPGLPDQAERLLNPLNLIAQAPNGQRGPGGGPPDSPGQGEPPVLLDRPEPADERPVPDHYVVVLRDDVPIPQQVANEHAQQHGLAVSHVYQ